MRLTNEQDVTAIALAEAGDKIFDRLFAQNPAARVCQDLKNGTLWYEGAQGVDDPSVTIRRLSVYGESGSLILARRAKSPRESV